MQDSGKERLLPAHTTESWQINYVSSIFYGLAILFLKLSICMLYLRLSPVKPFRYAVFFMMFAVLAFGIGGIIPLIAFCVPVEKAWDLTFPANVGHCIAGPKLSIGNAYFNVLTDIILLVLPLPTVWALQLPFRQKLAVTAVFSTGLLYALRSLFRSLSADSLGVNLLTWSNSCCATSIVRLVELQPLLKSPDITWNVNSAAMWR